MFSGAGRGQIATRVIHCFSTGVDEIFSSFLGGEVCPFVNIFWGHTVAACGEGGLSFEVVNQTTL